MKKYIDTGLIAAESGTISGTIGHIKYASIKVTVKSLDQANEIIEYWKDKDIDLEIEIKENTTTENSDVNGMTQEHTDLLNSIYPVVSKSVDFFISCVSDFFETLSQDQLQMLKEALKTVQD